VTNQTQLNLVYIVLLSEALGSKRVFDTAQTWYVVSLAASVSSVLGILASFYTKFPALATLPTHVLSTLPILFLFPDRISGDRNTETREILFAFAVILSSFSFLLYRPDKRDELNGKYNRL
jgi:hypothetical protein